MKREWAVEPMWAGATCAILASGPSMSAAVAETVRTHADVRVIAVNNTFKLARWADVLYAADERWWTKYHAETTGFLGLKVCAEQTPFPDVLLIDQTGGGGSGYGALAKIAVPAGCVRVLLCGFDMHGGHWHAKHEAPLRNAGEGIYRKWMGQFEALAPELAKRGVEVLNCTPGSALKCFPAVSLDAALAPRALVA